MAYVNSQSSDDEVVAAREDNASYDVEGDVAKCRAYIVATRIYLGRLVRSAAKDGESLETTPEQVQAELDAAVKWLQRNGRSSIASQPSYASFENFRS